MVSFVIRRFALMILLLFLLTIATFTLFNLVPRDPARLFCAKACSPPVIEDIRHKLELDIPITE